jgi:RES domain-containing protein
LLVYRITREKYANDLSGTGAKQYGGRWNSVGVPLLYTSSSISLSILEILVHLPKHLLPKDLVLITLEINEKASHLEILDTNLPKNWRHFPMPIATQKIGNIMVNENKCLFLKIPSIIVVSEINILINPLHKNVKQVKIQDIKPFSLDVRLFK